MISAVDRTSPVEVLSHIRNASVETGTDFDYLLRTAIRESSLDPSASAGTSSARGLFQFIEQTWLGIMKNYGAEHGLGSYADAIGQRNNGRYFVADPALRREILALREDPQVSSVMAGELTRESQSYLENRLQREVTGAELYVAHFLGPAGAGRLIEAASAGEPDASKLFPAAADANRSIFFNRDGTVRSAAEVYANLVAKHNDTAPLDLPPALAERLALAKAGEGDATSKALVALQMRPLGDLRVVSEDGLKAQGARMSGYPDFSLTDRVFQSQGDAPILITPFVSQILASLDPLPKIDPEAAAERTERQQGRRHSHSDLIS